MIANNGQPAWVAAAVRSRHLVAFAMTCCFVLLFFLLNSQAYLTFQVRAPDADRFNQAIWNLTQGRGLYSTIKDGSVLGNHFTPYFALLSPLFLIWSDVRILYFVQLLGFGITGLILYRTVERKSPFTGLLVLLLFLLNPTLHDVALYELRRVTFAMPWLGLAVYGLVERNRRWLLIGCAGALLCKEEIGLIVFGIGVFVAVVWREWRFGTGLMVFGIGWLLLMLTVVIPAFGNGSYGELSYFGGWGASLPEILGNMLRQPGIVWQTMFDEVSLRAFGRILLPFALILPFLGAEYLLIITPLTALMLLASEPEMHALERWYPSSLLPFLFAAVAVGLLRVPVKIRPIVATLLLFTTGIAYRQYSPAPFGNHFAPHRYTITERHRTAWEIIDRIPENASVAAQVALSTQLAQRETIRVYPWFEGEPTDYILLAEGWNAYPIENPDLHWEIVNQIVEPTNKVVAEGNGIYLLQTNQETAGAFPIEQTVHEQILLEGVDVATTDANGLFEPLRSVENEAVSGEKMRVSLLWRALDAPHVECTVSIRLTDAKGQLIAQNDSQPVEGSRPTTWWQPGWHLRDVHYLEIPDGLAVTDATLSVLLYDSYTQERILFDNGQEEITLATVRLQQTP